ncbi:hypothetical protein SLS58_010942 [Diplodia intermedia]|uniref:DUF7924 domain-containing protein n=1 Tax=Diplodia intermedia TaxID=856260 RepID=A0ABR3T337_9PEZI
MDPPRDSRKASTSSATSSDTTREKRSKPYHNPAFWIVLQINGSFPDEYTNGPVRGSLETSTGLCKQLLALHQDIPRDSLFSDEFFVETCEMLQDGSEAKITQDISRLIVPSAESLAIRGSKHLDILIESVKERLFKLIEREKELHREILAFSISHDNSTVRIYGHYPIIDEKDTKYCRHEIRNFVFRGQDGKERWTAYKFTKNVYDNWMPPHFKRICNAIDEIPPGISFGVPRLRSTSSSPELENLPPS